MMSEPRLDNLVKILAFFKEPIRYIIGVGIVAAIVLFSPDSIINKLGLLKYRDEGKPYLGGALLLCIAIIIANVIGFGVRKYDNHRFLRTGKKRLHRLTIEEKQILRGYIEGQTRSMDLSVTDGVVNGLVHERIIYRSSNLSNSMAGFLAFAHNIQPWAWDYLNEHRDLLHD
jgi:hypothetical protein